MRIWIKIILTCIVISGISSGMNDNILLQSDAIGMWYAPWSKKIKKYDLKQYTFVPSGKISQYNDKFPYNRIFLISKETLIAKNIDKNHRKPAYLGTNSGYHIFRIFKKFISRPDEVVKFAVKEESCKVENPRSTDKEIRIRSGSYRHLIISGNNCLVPDD